MLDILFAAFGLWLAGTAPISFAGGTYDDLLFLRLAASIAHGHWLGPFDQLTLARGPMFPLFLAAAALLRIPVNLAAQAVYLCGSLLLARLAGYHLRSRAAATAIFALLAVSPVPYATGLSLVMREKLYVGLTMLALALALRCLPRQGAAPARPADMAWAFAAGLGFAAFWLTREEGVWLLPALALILALRLTIRLCRRGRPDRRWVVGEALVCLLPALGFLAVVLPVAAINDAVYGVFRTDDFQTGPFPAAYGAMLRVKPAHWRQYVSLPRDVRARLYAVSAAARELRPSLEGAAGREWIRIGCLNSPLPACDDLQGGWAMFALRQAVTDAGHYASARDADRFYRRLAAEIDAACADRRLACTPPRSGMLPPLRWAYVPLALRSFWRVYVQTASLDRAKPGTLLTSPSIFDLAQSRPLALGPEAPPRALADAATVLVMGWIYAPAGTPLPSAQSVGGGSDTLVALSTTGDPAIAAAIGRAGGSAYRFQWQSRCAPDCRLLVTQGASVLLDRPASALRPGQTSSRSGRAAEYRCGARRAGGGAPAGSADGGGPPHRGGDAGDQPGGGAAGHAGHAGAAGVGCAAAPGAADHPVRVGAAAGAAHPHGAAGRRRRHHGAGAGVPLPGAGHVAGLGAGGNGCRPLRARRGATHDDTLRDDLAAAWGRQPPLNVSDRKSGWQRPAPRPRPGEPSDRGDDFHGARQGHELVVLRAVVQVGQQRKPGGVIERAKRVMPDIRRVGQRLVAVGHERRRARHVGAALRAVRSDQHQPARGRIARHETLGGMAVPLHHAGRQRQ